MGRGRGGQCRQYIPPYAVSKGKRVNKLSCHKGAVQIEAMGGSLWVGSLVSDHR